MQLLQIDPRKARTAEMTEGFSEEQARREGSRCLRCDLAYRCPTIVDTAKVAQEAQKRS
jgi:NADPH-dependent glutamate synthase beta subunit-like oxidoreductase